MSEAVSPSTAADEGGGPAAGVLMALVPCTVTVAHPSSATPHGPPIYLGSAWPGP
ncbi:hypothetical protein [Streptomyces sp. NPDC059919]|uniref:hypothetical protein n=1 Tax=Streptomyces sp. NPDC059919 TaxID=3347004 RepID=UPI0036562D0B